MKKVVIFFWCGCITIWAQSQPVTEKLQRAFQQFENDSQLCSALASLYVVDAVTGNAVFDKNSRIGFAPASTQKIITSATAYELLGKTFRYKTILAYDGTVTNGILKGNLYLIGSGDPTLGSWRWAATKETAVLNRMMNAIRRLNIRAIEGTIVVDNYQWNYETIPDGWIWQDIGSYYGAGATKLNWRENQYDILLKSGKHIGDSVTIVGTDPEMDVTLESVATAAAKGSGDNAYVYYPLGAPYGMIRGTIPVNENGFKISGALPQPENALLQALKDSLQRSHIAIQPLFFAVSENYRSNPNAITVIHTEYSPPLDSIIYWFLKKSINLYGEALVKTMAYQQKGMGATDTGVAIIQKFWKAKGLDETELNIVDGSGLSPLNRVTTHAQVTVLQYAKTQPWYAGFYEAFPQYNGIKMKSGTIHGVKGFTGYHTSKNGPSYIFSFLVNNYNGPSGTLVQKMYKVLDALK